MYNYRVVYKNLPYGIKGLTLHSTTDDYFTIILNSRMSYNMNLKTFRHELIHVQDNRYEIGEDINIVEMLAHN